MTMLGKTLFVTLGLAVLIGGIVALHSEPEPAALTVLTPAQIAELQPAAKPVDPPKAAPATDDAHKAQPPEPEVEDGSGS
jgi:hypothetical protein